MSALSLPGFLRALDRLEVNNFFIKVLIQFEITGRSGGGERAHMPVIVFVLGGYSPKCC